MGKKQLSQEGERYWRAFQNRAALPLQHVAPKLGDRALQSDKHFGITIATSITADLYRALDGVKIIVLSNAPSAFKLFKDFKSRKREIEAAIGLQIPPSSPSGNADFERSFVTPVMGPRDLTVLTTREDAEHDWFIEMVIRLSSVIQRLVEEFKQYDKDTIL